MTGSDNDNSIVVATCCQPSVPHDPCPQLCQCLECSLNFNPADVSSDFVIASLAFIDARRFDMVQGVSTNFVMLWLNR